MKHVAMLIPTIDQIGGAERQLLLLACELSTRGWQVTIISLSGPTSPSNQQTREILVNAGVEHLSLEMRKAWIDSRGWQRYLAWHRCHKPQIVHAHLPHATWFARWIRLLAPVPVLIDTIHTSNTGGIARRLSYRLSEWLSTHTTCVSNPVADATLAARMARKIKLTVLPNGVVLPATHAPATTRELSFQCFKWLAVGRLAAVKDYPTLFYAFARLPGNATLLIAGTGPEEAALKQLAYELKIDSRVHFAGFQPDVPGLLRNSDGFVLSSRWEGLPMGILEASAASLPIVATDGPGTREAMLVNQTGLIVPVANVAALSSAMAQIMTMTSEDRNRMGNLGRRFVEANFELTKIAQQWETLYIGLLTKHPHPTRWH
ncbi:glycosyltransferase [Acidicapsa ligni]|uniref:glycosyltransferase n=1 Tax=Acidicapsa ligni TaxID=542300 RepID=UPI0021E0F279|nr:glycosyltransferase [Acidicapsa ligni]